MHPETSASWTTRETVEVYDPDKGQNVNAQIFVAVPGYSNYTYAEATGSQSSRDWLASHCRAFEYFGPYPPLSFRKT